MILTGDYHTHTKYSHGKNTVLENALRAKELGLKEIAITDHGFAHPAFGLSKRKVESLKSDCRKASEITGVNVKVGIESNIVCTDGRVDLEKDMYKHFDVFLAGFHKFILFKGLSFFKLFTPNFFHTLLKSENVPKSVVDTTTRTYINVIKNNPVDILTHVNFCCYANAVEVAKCCADYGTYMELNSKKVHLTDEELFEVAKTGVNFVIDSDAHSVERIGEISLVEQALKRVDISEDRIMNINGKIPKFRFAEYKEKNL